MSCWIITEICFTHRVRSLSPTRQNAVLSTPAVLTAQVMGQSTLSVYRYFCTIYLFRFGGLFFLLTAGHSSLASDV